MKQKDYEDYKSVFMDEVGEDPYIYNQRQLIKDFFFRWKKEIKLKKLEMFLKMYKHIKSIKVIGHSMSDVDSKYMETIERILKPKHWYILQHNGNPSLNDLSGYSFKYKVIFLKLTNGKLSVLKQSKV